MLNESARGMLRSVVPAPVRRAYWTSRRHAHAAWDTVADAPHRFGQLGDRWAMTSLQFRRLGGLSYGERRRLIRRLADVNVSVLCAHTHAEMAEMIAAILDMPPTIDGCIVEAGCYKGGSTVKLSIAAKIARRRLVVFDSFEGLPPHDERHGKTIFGVQTGFVAGLYAGSLEEVTSNVRRHGEIDACEFRKGWFDATMPAFDAPVAVAFLDVDLAASTRTCLRYLYPRLVPGGVIFSHDGHLPLCMDVFCDASLWREIGVAPPCVEGLGTRKLVSIRKPLAGDQRR